MKAVFFVIDYVPHQITTIKQLALRHNVEILAYHVGLLTQHLPQRIENFESIDYKRGTSEEMLRQILSFGPDFILVAGWMIPKYTALAKKLKKKLKIPIVSYSDTQWHGHLTQRINAAISSFHLQKAFTHLWVTGVYQYEYARHLGFKKQNIIFNAHSADIELFQNVSISKKKKEYPKNFLYIGRFVAVKGLDKLLAAWDSIIDKRGWTLTLIGDGILKDMLKGNTSIIVKDFMSQSELIVEIENSGCFVLPSVREPWAVVIHEAAAAGLPIICTDVCGAAPHFVIDGHNGFKVTSLNHLGLKNAMESIMDATVDQLVEYSLNSRNLSNKITPIITGDSLMQVVR